MGGDDVFTEVDLSGGEATLPLPHPGNPSNRSMRRSPRRSWTELRNIRLRRSREIPAEGVVVTVEAREAKVVDEKSIESSLYDPLKDLNNYQRPPRDAARGFIRPIRR